MESEYSFLKIFKFYEVSNKFDVKGGLRQSFINDQRIGHIDKWVSLAIWGLGLAFS